MGEIINLKTLETLWLQTSTLSSPSALTISGLSTTTTTVVHSTRRKLRSLSRRPLLTCQVAKSSLMRTSRPASRNSTRTAVAPSRRTRWQSSSRRLLDCEHKIQLAENEDKYDFKAYSNTQPTSLMQHQPIPAVKESKVWRDKDIILTSDCEVKFKRFSHALKL